MLDVRKILEPPLASRAAKHATDAEVARLEEIYNRQREKVKRGEIAIEEDSEFHYALAKAARNRVVLRVVDVLMDLLQESRERSLQVPGRLQKSLEGHWRILDAVKRHEPGAAAIAMQRHLTEIEDVLLKSQPEG